MSPAREPVEGEFEQRMRALLVDSAEALPAAVRSRLTQARYAALAARDARAGLVGGTRRWALPAGVLAAAVLAVVIGVHPTRTTAPTATANVFEDVELLADGDAMPMVQEASSNQGADYDFYEWAVSEAAAGDSGAANAAGT